jgi:hypothetical protein
MEATAVPIIPPANDKPPKDLPKEERATPQEPPPKSTRKSATTPTGRPNKFAKELAEFMSMPALLFEFKGDLYCAYVWNTRITKHAYAWATLAEKNPALKRRLEAMMEGGDYGAVILTGLSVLVPILAYYGVYPPSMLNPFALSPQEQAEFDELEGNVSSSTIHNQFNFSMDVEDDEGAIPHPIG